MTSVETKAAQLSFSLMKDVFAQRSVTAFWELMNDFTESLSTTFPECAETKDWCLWFRNVIKEDKAQQTEGVKKWVVGMEETLKKGSAKYAKAVQSITGTPATVFHAVAYKDVDAAHATSEQFRGLNLPAKLKSDAMDDDGRAIFWQYFEELNRHAFAACRKPTPTIPTPAEIDMDIKRRKGGGSSNSGAPLQNGLKEVWLQLLETCGASLDEGSTFANLGSRLSKVCKTEAFSSRVKGRHVDAWKALEDEFPELAGKTPVDETWSLLDKALGLSAMEDAIPAPMMRGIEDVANKLVQDIANGKADLSTLNIEAIGQQVLNNVSSDEVASFANNLDKILPAIDRLQR